MLSPSRELIVDLLIEGEIPTTHIVHRLIREALGNHGAVRQRMVSEYSPRDFERGALPLLVRVGDPGAMPILKWMVSRGLPYLYYIDDNFWALKGAGPLAAYYQSKEVRETLEFAVTNAAAVIVNSMRLGSFLKTEFDAKVYVLNAPFDFSLLGTPSAEKKPAGAVRIGFAGSVSRDDDFIVLLPAIERILSRYPQVEFYFFGYCPRPLIGRERVTYVTHVDSYEQFIKIKQSAQLDIGLAPIAALESNYYKTNNKYREYGAIGVAGIYTDSPPYKDCIQDGTTGLLVPHHEDAWFKAMSRLIEDASLRKAIAEAALSDVQSHYAQEVVAKQWYEVLCEYAEKANCVMLSPRSLFWDTVSIKSRSWLARQRLHTSLRLARIRRAFGKSMPGVNP